MEHRWGVRMACDIAVRVDARPQALAAGLLRDASLSGGYIETSARLLPWTLVFVELEWPGFRQDEPHRIHAYVVRGEPAGLAVEWCEFAPDPIRAVLALVRDRVAGSPSVETGAAALTSGIHSSSSRFPSRHGRDVRRTPSVDPPGDGPLGAHSAPCREDFAQGAGG